MRNAECGVRNEEPRKAIVRAGTEKNMVGMVFYRGLHGWARIGRRSPKRGTGKEFERKAGPSRLTERRLVLIDHVMPATTVQLEADIAEKAAALRSPNRSLSALVRVLIEKEHRERQSRATALTYALFLADHPEESAAMEAWESAPLAEPAEMRGL